MISDIVKPTLLLGAFAFCGTALLLWIGIVTKDKIREEEYKTLLSRLNEIVPADRYNNDLVKDNIQIIANNASGAKSSSVVYRARKDGKPVATVLSVIAPDGYSGAIHLLVGIYTDGKIAGVRATKHKETPGLGDAIEVNRSDWILNFAGKSLGNPGSEAWAIKKDGGDFDSFTGATITPRAVIKATHKVLEYFADNKQMLFEKIMPGEPYE